MTKNNQKITEDWNIKKLGEMGKFVSGGTPDTEKPEYWNGDIIWLTPSEITKLPTRFVSDSERKITRAGLKNSSAVLLPVGSLIICTRATVGDCCINIKEVSTNQGFKNLIPENSNIDFLYYLISSHKTDLIRKACGSTFLEISKHDIEKLKYSVPPLPEQEKIAEILGAWDLAIEKLTALIEQKKLLKKGLMQRLLTGKQRLPGFSAPWKKLKLGDFLEIKHGKNQKAIECQNGIFPILATGGEIGRTNTFIYDKPSVLIGRKGTINKPQYIETPFWTVDTLFWSKMKETNIAKFFYYLFQMIKWEVWDEGSTIPSLNASTIMSIKIKISDNVSEQKAIADILSKADEEIDLLTRKLDLLQSQKKGLMQQLLTGKIRVKVA